MKARFLFREGGEFREHLGRRTEEWEWGRQPDSAAGRKEGAAFPEDLPRGGGVGSRGSGLAPSERRTREAPATLRSVRSVMEAPRASRGHRPRLGHLPGPRRPSRRDLGSRARDRGRWQAAGPGRLREAAHLPWTRERERAAGRAARGRTRCSGRSRAAAARVTRKSQPQGRPDIGGAPGGRAARVDSPAAGLAHVRRSDALLTAGPSPGAEPASAPAPPTRRELGRPRC